MRIDNKYSVFKVRRFAGAYTSFSTMAESIGRQLETKLPFVHRVIVQESKSSDSVYYEVSFKDNISVFEFRVSNHEAHETYNGETFLLQWYGDEQELYESIRGRLIEYHSIEDVNQVESNDELSPFGEMLMNALKG